MSANQNFAKRTGECLKEVKANNGYACASLSEYRTRRAMEIKQAKQMSFEATFRPAETPFGIWSSPAAAARSRPGTAPIMKGR